MSRNLNPTFRGHKLLLAGFVEEGLRVVLTTPDTLTDNDYQVATNLTIAGAVALTGPSNAGVGTLLRIYDQKGDAATNNVTLTPAAGETVEGAATLVINVNYGCVEIEKESATNWKVVSRSFASSGALAAHASTHQGGGSDDLFTGNTTYLKHVDHTISVAASTTASAVGGFLAVAGGPGTPAASTVAAGVGGVGSVTGGVGGAAHASAGAAGGVGGVGRVAGGAGGAAAAHAGGTAGVGGKGIVIGGTGGAASASAVGGLGGEVQVTGGAGGAGSAGQAAGAGNAVTIRGGAAGADGGGGGGNGGALTLDGGAATGAGTAGAIAIGTTTASAITIGRNSIGVAIDSAITMAANKGITYTAGTGGLDGNAGTGAFRIGAASATISHYGVTAVAQPSSVGETVGFTAGAGAAVLADSTFTGNSGTKAYTIGDVVKHLKALGLLAAS